MTADTHERRRLESLRRLIYSPYPGDEAGPADVMELMELSSKLGSRIATIPNEERIAA